MDFEAGDQRTVAITSVIIFGEFIDSLIMTQFMNIKAQSQKLHLNLQNLVTVEMPFLNTHYTDSLKSCKRPPNAKRQ